MAATVGRFLPSLDLLWPAASNSFVIFFTCCSCGCSDSFVGNIKRVRTFWPAVQCSKIMLGKQQSCRSVKLKSTLSRTHSGLPFTIAVATSVAAMKRSLSARFLMQLMFNGYTGGVRCSPLDAVISCERTAVHTSTAGHGSL